MAWGEYVSGWWIFCGPLKRLSFTEILTGARGNDDLCASDRRVGYYGGIQGDVSVLETDLSGDDGAVDTERGEKETLIYIATEEGRLRGKVSCFAVGR